MPKDTALDFAAASLRLAHPDVLLDAHVAPLQFSFYEEQQFAEHGSRKGYLRVAPSVSQLFIPDDELRIRFYANFAA